MMAIAGCNSLETALKWKIPLQNVAVTAMSASLRDKNGIAPGQNTQLIVSITDTSGAVLYAGSNGTNKIMWDDLLFTGDIVSVNQRGEVSMPDDPRVTDGKLGHIVITVPSHPEIHAEINVPVRYDAKYRVNFSGHAGLDGASGLNGIDGFTGMPGSMIPTSPSPGGNGGNGTDGSNGQDGGMGTSAPPVQVKVTLSRKALLQVEVEADHQQKFFLIDPNGGSLSIRADGGKGGAGGSGGRGGKGGMGGTGTPSGMNGMDGHDGLSGYDGVAGRGGLITVIYDPSAKPYLKILHLSSWNGPRPLFVESHVDPLW